MPQVFIGNKRTLTKKVLAAIGADKPAAVTLYAEKSAWNNGSIMVKILALLAAAVAPHAEAFQPILLLDCANCHLTTAVLEEARKLGILLVFVPASATPYLQPLDASGFQAYKAFLRRAYCQLQQNSDDGSVDLVAWIRALMAAQSRFFCSRRWDAAFTSVGAGAAKYDQLSTQLRRQVPDMAVAAGPPSDHDLAALFPRGRAPLRASFLSLDQPRRRLRLKTSL